MAFLRDPRSKLSRNSKFNPKESVASVAKVRAPFPPSRRALPPSAALSVAKLPLSRHWGVGKIKILRNPLA